MADYPTRWEADVVLADGGTVHVRPIRPDDGDRLRALHDRLSPETIYLRFFSPVPKLSDSMVERFTHVDYVDRLALVAMLGDEIVARGRATTAWRGRRRPRWPSWSTTPTRDGAWARCCSSTWPRRRADHGITEFVAETLPGNNRMLARVP